jgi:predicted PurR-regulated permease PerM
VEAGFVAANAPSKDWPLSAEKPGPLFLKAAPGRKLDQRGFIAKLSAFGRLKRGRRCMDVKQGEQRQEGIRGAVWLIAAGVIVAGLYFLREPLIQFALALILWLAIDGLTEAAHKRFSALPRWGWTALFLLGVLGLLALLVWGIAANISQMAGNAGNYQARLDGVTAQIYSALRLPGAAPTIADLVRSADPRAFVGGVADGLQSLTSNLIFILIFLAFLFPAASRMPAKLDRIFTDEKARAQAREVLLSIRESMQKYLWVQTVLSAIITVLSYITLRLIGLEQALFWSFLIFFLNYIPTIGSVVAVALPTAFALVQFNTLTPILLVAAGLHTWQFTIGNLVQPRMTGQSLNLSAVVVLLALALWGAIWGVAGAFLAAPLTVMLMIVLAQFRSTRWIAILLSENGKPVFHHAAADKLSNARK